MRYVFYARATAGTGRCVRPTATTDDIEYGPRTTATARRQTNGTAAGVRFPHYLLQTLQYLYQRRQTRQRQSAGMQNKRSSRYAVRAVCRVAFDSVEVIQKL